MMSDKKEQDTFEMICKQNERRIHFHIHKLNIRDPHQDFYQEGLFALWNAYENYQPDKGTMSTYFNYIIRNRLIDMVRKETRVQENNEQVISEHKIQLDDGNHLRGTENAYPIQGKSDITIKDNEMWQHMKAHLTQNQWKWVHFHIIIGMTLKEISIQENTTSEAVKSWGKQVKKKLRNDEFRKKIVWDLDV